MTKKSWASLIVTVLISLITFIPFVQGEAESLYKPFTGALILGGLQDTDKWGNGVVNPALDRFASLNTIVIDPGHGGSDAGAVGPTGLQEKDVVLRIAKTLKTLLQTGLGSHVILTREADIGLSHEERAGMANSLKADLFISIHTAASPERTMKGMEVFLASASEELSGPIGGGTSGESSGLEENLILSWRRVHLRYLPMSRLLGRLVELNLRQEMDRAVTVKELPMITLEGVNMPSLELDVGYITTLSTETELKRDALIGRLGKAIYNSIKQYKEMLILSRRQP